MKKTALPFFSTSVDVYKTQAEIRNLLVNKFGCTGIRYDENVESGDYYISFAFKKNDNYIPFRYQINMKKIYEILKDSHPRGEKGKILEQAGRTAMRILYHFLKSALDMYVIGLLDIEDIFMANLLLVGADKTMGEIIKPQLVNMQLVERRLLNE